MNATTAPSPSLRRHPRRVEAARSTSVEVAEEHRWVRLLVVPFTAGATFFAIAIATGTGWPMGVAVVLGPIALIFAFIYLCISCDANGSTPQS